MAEMRPWLEAEYGVLSQLNRAWGTTFKSWKRVLPLTSQEALERREKGNWNFAPWADHRTFMTDTFVNTCLHAVEIIREYNPDAVVGVSGMSAPGVFGGHDLSKLFSTLEWFEPYEGGRSVVRAL